MVQLIQLIRGFILFSLFTFLGILVYPAESKISGRLPGGSGNEIRFITYTDYISNTEILLDRFMIDSVGNFSLHTDLTETISVVLDLDYYSTTLYLEPGKNYILEFDSISTADQYRPFYEKEPLVFRIVSDDPEELNSLIFEFSDRYYNFLLENFQTLYNRRDKSLIDTFKSETDQKFSNVKNNYFKDFIEYKIAVIELSGSGTIKPKLFRKYLQGKPILYSHPAYMEFFNQFFDQYLTAGNKFISEKDLEKGINELISYPALMDSLGKDTLLISESLRELVLIKSLKDLYYSPYYFPQNILSILDQIFATSPFSMHRSIALNVRQGLLRLHKGTFAPEFTLPDLTGSPVSLKDQKGKTVYLSFLTTWTYACLGEFEILDSLFNIWGKEVEFITVSLDKNPKVVERFKNDKNYKWTFLYNGTSYELIQDYGIKTFPLFVLIDPDGKILQYPAIKPSEGIGDVFTYLKQKSKE